MNTKYKVEVYVMFDRLDGSGVKKNILYSKEFTTECGITASITCDAESIRGEYTLNGNAELVGSKLYINNELYKESSTLSYFDVYSNTQYRLEVIYRYDLNNEFIQDSISNDITTGAKEAPEVDFSYSSTYDSISIIRSILL